MNTNLPSFFLSLYILISLPLEKYILSKEHDFFSTGLIMFLIISLPDFLITKPFPGPSTLIESWGVLNTVFITGLSDATTKTSSSL